MPRDVDHLPGMWADDSIGGTIISGGPITVMPWRIPDIGMGYKLINMPVVTIEKAINSKIPGLCNSE